jgi:exportin-5
VRVTTLLILGAFALPWNVSPGSRFCSGEDEIAEDNPESQEMLEEQLVRMLTREAMDLISK